VQCAYTRAGCRSSRHRWWPCWRGTAATAAREVGENGYESPRSGSRKGASLCLRGRSRKERGGGCRRKVWTTGAWQLHGGGVAACGGVSLPPGGPPGRAWPTFICGHDMCCARSSRSLCTSTPHRPFSVPLFSSPRPSFRLASPSPWYASAPRAPRFAVSLLRLCGPLTPAAAAPPPSHSARKPKHCYAKAA
jgi:hypothetical protein